MVAYGTPNPLMWVRILLVVQTGGVSEWFMVRAWKVRGCKSPIGSNPIFSALAPCGGIGRRARFKIWCPKGRVGSTPTGGT